MWREVTSFCHIGDEGSPVGLQCLPTQNHAGAFHLGGRQNHSYDLLVQFDSASLQVVGISHGTINARYILGKKSVPTYQLSRSDQVLPTEWSLLPWVFDFICKVYGHPHTHIS